MKIITIRVSLLCILLGSLAIEVIAAVVARNRMWPEEFQALLIKLLGVYSAQIGLVLGGLVVKRRIKKQSAPLGLALTALGLTLFWTLLVGWRPFSLMFPTQDSIRQVVNYLDEVSAAASFILAAGLTYFFTAEGD